MSKKLNVLIFGLGPTGSVLAHALSNYNCCVDIYDIKSEEELMNKDKVYALTHSSRRLLQKIDLWDDLYNQLNPFNDLILNDYELNKKLKFSLGDLSKYNRDHQHLGWIIEHNKLMSTIISRIKNNRNINCHFNESISLNNEKYDFVFAADGINSSCRKIAGIKSFKRDYNQGCLTAKVVMRGANPSVAYEIFRKEGPFAILPIDYQTCQVIWSSKYSTCLKRERMSTSLFLDHLASILPIGYEPDCLISKPKSFPISLFLAASFSKGNIILLGESAHCIHPVGGQGLNLCWRDVEKILYLISLLENHKINLKQLSTLYNISRYIDVIFLSIFTDLLVFIFSSKNFLIKYFRLFVLINLKHFKFIRRFLFKIMTDGPIKSILSHLN